MIEVLIKRLSNNVELPKYETNGSSGMDLSANIDKQIKIEPGKTSIIPTGISLAIPENFEIQIRPRSGLAAKNQISVLNTPGTIDADYRGELKVILINLSNKTFVVEGGARIAQMVLCPIVKAKFKEVDNLDDTSRGTGGFGSTGLK
jgi:dUTP pyrophosphatase